MHITTRIDLIAEGTKPNADPDDRPPTVLVARAAALKAAGAVAEECATAQLGWDLALDLFDVIVNLAVGKRETGGKASSSSCAFRPPEPTALARTSSGDDCQASFQSSKLYTPTPGVAARTTSVERRPNAAASGGATTARGTADVVSRTGADSPMADAAHQLANSTSWALENAIS